MKQIRSILLVVCALCMVINLTACCTNFFDGFMSVFENASPSDVKYADASVSTAQIQHGPLALVNYTHVYAFPSEATANLICIWEYRNEHTQEGASSAYKTNMNTLLDTEATEAVHNWLTDFYNATGNGNVFISSAYRTFEEQYVFSVPAGYSDHHTGYGVALKLYDGTQTMELDRNPECKDWLTENAYKYGLVVRYPEGKEYITGLSDYTNYFHYVGIAPAKYMTDNDLCLEEFNALIQDYSVENPLQVTDDENHNWLIYYTYCPDEKATVQLPINFNFTMSGDNEGGVIVCVCLAKSEATN